MSKGEARFAQHPRALRRVAPYWRALLRRMRFEFVRFAEGGRFVPERISVPVVQFDPYDEGILTRMI